MRATLVLAVASIVTLVMFVAGTNAAFAGKGGAGSGITTTSTGRTQGPAVRYHSGETPQKPFCRHRCAPGDLILNTERNFGGNARDHR